MADVMEIPSLGQLEEELARVKKKKRRSRAFSTAVFAVITLLAACILAAALWLPLLQVYGSAMAPTCQRGDVLAALRTEEYGCGDIVAFYHNNTIQVRRLIAGPGSRVEIDEEGRITVDGVLLEEPWLTDTALGQCDLEMPYQVPDGCWFVLGDNRAESIDSRSSVLGCVSRDRIIGRILLRVWPLETFGLLEPGEP